MKTELEKAKELWKKTFSYYEHAIEQQHLQDYIDNLEFMEVKDEFVFRGKRYRVIAKVTKLKEKK